MKKKELIEQLKAAKTLTSTVDIDKMIGMLNQLETTTLNAELANEITNRIERALDHNCDDLFDKSSAEFDLDYDNRIQLTRVDVDVYSIIEHVVAIVDEYVELEDDEEDLQVEAYNENSVEEDDPLQAINKGLGLEPGGNPYVEI